MCAFLCCPHADELGLGKEWKELESSVVREGPGQPPGRWSSVARLSEELKACWEGTYAPNRLRLSLRDYRWLGVDVVSMVGIHIGLG